MSIDQHNYEEWMVAFLDGELSTEELLEFNEFMTANPNLKEELAAFEGTQFESDNTLVFENKEVLYKKAGALVLLKKAWPLAAAIVFGIAIWPFINNETEELPVVAKEKKIENNIEQAPRNVSPVVEKEIIEEPMQPAPKKAIAQLPKTPGVQQLNATVPAVRKEVIRKQKTIEKVQKQYVDVPKVPVQEKEIEKTPESKIIDQPLKEVVLVKEKSKSSPEPKPILLPNPMELEEQEKALLVINEDTHPLLYEKINTVVDEVENKIKTIKQLKEEPITVCIGKLKLFTLNN